VAPSANPSGRLSPTRAADVARDFGDAIGAVLDGGDCPAGVESTVIDARGDVPALLRAGALPREAIEAIAGPLAAAEPDAADAPRSPGRLLRHYAPRRARLRLNAAEPNPGEAYLGFGPCLFAELNLSPERDLVRAAARLFSHLRALDEAGYGSVAVAPIPNAGLGEAINDRLARAAGGDPPCETDPQRGPCILQPSEGRAFRRAFVMRTIRKANFFYPGFEMAGAETQFERGLTRLFCMAAGIGMALYDALSAAHPKRQEG
jgi:hypothetical protein